MRGPGVFAGLVEVRNRLRKLRQKREEIESEAIKLREKRETECHPQ